MPEVSFSKCYFANNYGEGSRLIYVQNSQVGVISIEDSTFYDKTADLNDVKNAIIAEDQDKF